MRKCRFITGAMVFGLSLLISVTSLAQISGSVERHVCAGEDGTTSSKNAVGSSNNKGLENHVKALSLVIGTPISFFDTITTDEEAESNEEKSRTEDTEKGNNTKKKNVKKKNAKNKETKKSNKKKENSKSKKSGLKKLGTYRITAYCGCTKCCGKSDGITASGTKAKEGRTIAADTSKLSFGTKVVIGSDTYVVEDRGGRISGNRIDIYFNSHSDALKWGVKYMDVYVKK